MRSHTGCLTCRNRKVKCDEAKPACGPCVKASRDCVFSQAAIFRNFEHHTLPRRSLRRDKSKKKAHSRQSSLFEEGDVWVDVPSDLTFIQVENPYEPDGAPETLDDGLHAKHPTLNVALSEQDLDGDAIVTSTEETGPNMTEIPTPHSGYHTPSTPKQPTNNGSSSVVLDIGTGDWTESQVWDRVGDYDADRARYTPALPEYQSTPDRIDPPGEHNPSSNITALHLIRYFKEGPGQWLDLFDTSAYFSSKVPVMASKSPLLKASICAVAAKHLSRAKMPTPFRDTQSSSPSRSNDRNWKYLSADYYHRAIGYLKAAVNSLGVDDGLLHSSCPPEEIFAAVAVLCIYELMDAPGTAWKAHLTALPLFVPSSDSTATDCSTTVTIPRTAIKGPLFWCLARQDFLCACIGETQTRLKLEDMRLWHRVGLATDETRFQLPFSPSSFADSSASAEVEEDVKSNEIVRILSRVINFITSGDAVDPKDYARPPGQRPQLGVTQERLLRRWNIIMDELSQWRAELPPTFEPSARTKIPSRPSDGLLLSSPSPSPPPSSPPISAVSMFEAFEQIWYDLPGCAGTMVNYHMAMILLLANRPQESTAIRSTVSARLRNYRQDHQGVLYHSREICGINLAEVPASLRIHSVQPIFVAGQVFHRVQDQEAVLELLSSVERDIGWSTSYYIGRLKDEWGVSE